jgi:hypothetical protein
MKYQRRESTQCMGHALVGKGETGPVSIGTIHMNKISIKTQHPEKMQV